MFNEKLTEGALVPRDEVTTEYQDRGIITGKIRTAAGYERAMLERDAESGHLRVTKVLKGSGSARIPSPEMDDGPNIVRGMD